MKEIKIYRALTFILLPFGVMFGIEDLSVIFSALDNPPLLLSACILACIVIYIFSSLAFYYKVFLKSIPSKKVLKDLIKVNAIVSIIFAVLCIASCIFFLVVLTHPGLLKEVSKQMSAQPKNSFSFDFNDPQFLSAIKKSIAIMLPFSLMLLVHIIITFRLLKKKKEMFI